MNLVCSYDLLALKGGGSELSFTYIRLFGSDVGSLTQSEPQHGNNLIRRQAQRNFTPIEKFHCTEILCCYNRLTDMLAVVFRSVLIDICF